MSAAEAPSGVRYVEDRIPLEGIEDAVEAMVAAHGGSVRRETRDAVSFALPVRRGVAASGEIRGTIRWEPGDEGGRVTIEADDEERVARGPYLALLIAGTVGSLLFILWPFFPALGPASWVGGALAFAAYFLTLKRSRGGTIARLLDNIASAQRRQ